MKKRRQIENRKSPEMYLYKKCNNMLSCDTQKLYTLFDEVVNQLTIIIEPKIKVILFDRRNF